MIECDACGALAEDYVKGYLAAGTRICRPCYNYMENEIFTASPSDTEED